MFSNLTRTLVISLAMTLPAGQALGATTDGLFGGLGEYSYNSENPANSKQDTHGHGTSGGHGGNGDGAADSEFNDGSGGDRYDLNYLGFDIAGGRFQFGAVGGSILQDPHLGVAAGDIDRDPLLLGDIAISVTDFGNDGFQDPTQNGSQSDQWQYAIRILSMASNAFTFSVLTAAAPQWLDVDIYGLEASGGGHHSDTFRMENGQAIADGSGNSVFSGVMTPDTDANDGADDYVLEGSFDLGLLALFDEQTGGRIITYLTMSCTNDEAIAIGDIAAVPLPAALWLFGSALIGFIGISRRTRV